MPLSSLSLHKKDAASKAKKLKAILFDVDGVLTEGSIIHDYKGREIKHFNVQDGLGIYFARTNGFTLGIITGRESEVVRYRAEELKIDYLSMGKKNKLKPYAEFKEKFGFEDEEICFVGDDLLDLPIMLRCGFAATVANGREEVKKESDFIAEAHGGRSGVREIIEFILRCQDKWDGILKNYYES